MWILLSIHFKAKQWKNGEYGILHFCPGLEFVPDSVLTKDWKSHHREKKEDLQCDWNVLFAFGVLFQFIGLWNLAKLFANVRLWPESQHITWMAAFVNWKVIVGLDSWCLSIIAYCFPVWILYPHWPTPQPQCPPTTEKWYFPSLAKHLEGLKK